MGKQMEGDNQQRRKAAAKARQAGDRPSDHGMTTGGSKQRSRARAKDDHETRLETTQRGEAKQAGSDVPGPVRGKGRRNEPSVPPGPR